MHVAAPGAGVLSTHYSLAAQPPQYREYGGTSASAAHVSAAQVRAHLVASADPSPYLKGIARGRLSLQRAICTLS